MNHQPIKCTPTKIFHRRVSHNALDLEFNNPVHSRCTKTKLKTLVYAVNQNYKQNISNILAEFHKYMNYYDRKAQVQALEVGDYTFLPNPNYNTQSDKTQFKTFLWNDPYKVMKVLSYPNYMVHKNGTHKTQCVSAKSFHTRITRIIQWMNQFYSKPDVIEES